MLGIFKMYGFVIKCYLTATLSLFLDFQKVESSSSVNSTEIEEIDSQPNYVSYNLENSCNAKTEKMELHIDKWKGAIFQVGYIYDREGSPKSRAIHKCTVKIKTNDEFWLVAAIEHMKIRGSRDSSNKWKCSDYVQFSSPGRILGKFLAVLDIDIFNFRSSEKLCGDKHLDGDNLGNIIDLSTDANSFSTASSEMHFTFHQDNDEKHTLNNSFKIVVTTFRHASEQVFAVECKMKQKCYGRDVYCIDKSFICDGHVNCAFPGSGTDERLCKADQKPDFNLTSIIIITLMSIVSLGIVICIISTIICRVKSHLTNDRRASDPVFTNVPLSQYPSAPGLDSEAPLPPYESVILSDNNSDKNSDEITEGELPPKYESLFPENTER